MRSQKNVEKFMKNAVIHSDPDVNQAVLKDLLHQFDQIQEQESAAMQPKIRRTIMKSPITKLAVAATVVVALGILTSWMTSGGSTNIAFANVADALDSLQSATYDIASEVRVDIDNGQPLTATVTGKGFFLAPSHQRMEITVNGAERRINLPGQPGEHVTIPKFTMSQVVIIDGQTAKSITLMPEKKSAILTEKKEFMTWSAKGAPTDMFEQVRRLIREGSSGTGEKVEKLGKKEIDGREAVGFRTHAGRTDIILWADPETARPIHIETTAKVSHVVMNNFRYDVDLDPSLFSLKVPAGYTTP